jgi:AraC family transcriptional activator of pobA
LGKDLQHIPLYKIKTKEMASLGFDIIDVVGSKGKAYDSTEAHRHTFFELFFFKSGKGIHEIDFNHYPIEANSAHFVSPGQIHHLDLKNTKGQVLCFTEDFVSLKSKGSFVEDFPFYDSGNPPFLKLSKVLSDEIAGLIDSANRDIDKLRESNHDLLHAYLNIILLKIRGFFLDKQKNAPQPTHGREQKVVLFKKLVNELYSTHRSVSDYALQLNLSPNYLNALCKKHEGKTATQLIQDRLLLESKRLLYATDMNVKEISFYLKFEDVSYFNRFFKKQTRLTPVQYRRQALKND